jgi:pSer/pThr/pTyr-binding forkhead associated (FHA) protein
MSLAIGGRLNVVSAPPDEFDSESTLVKDHSVATVRMRLKKVARLEQKQGPGAPHTYELELHETVVGRSAMAHICIDSHLISRKHVSFSKTSDQVTVTDLNSSNGMYLNGVKAHSAILHEGDQIQIGNVVFIFHEGE